MKRTMALLLACAMLLSFSACGDAPKDTTTTTTTTANATTTTTETTENVTTTTDTADSTTTTATQKVTTTAPITKPNNIVCAHTNTQAASCTAAARCKDCGTTIGEALGHNYVGKTCSRCGEDNPGYVQNIAVSSVKLNESKLTMISGDKETLTAKVGPVNATDKTLKWASSNAAVATVSATGEVTAISAGTATITATSVNGKVAKCTVEVSDVVVELPDFKTIDRISVTIVDKDRAFVGINFESAEYTYTKTGAQTGNLIIILNKGRACYNNDVADNYAQLQWQLKDSMGKKVADGIATSEEILTGTNAVTFKCEVASLAPGQYTLYLPTAS